MTPDAMPTPPAMGERRRTRAPDRRREDLLAAATRLLLERGIEATSVADIAREAGVAKGTFYLYFQSRDELLAALRGQFGEAAASRLEELTPPESPDGWTAFLDALTDEAITFFLEHAEVHGLLAGWPHEHAPDQGEGPVLRELVGSLARTIERGLDSGALDVPDPAIAAELLLDMLHGAAHQALAAPGAIHAVRATTRAMVRGSLVRHARG